MINRLLTLIFGSQHQRDVKKMLPIVAAINEMEPQIQALSDDGLRAKTEEFKRRLAEAQDEKAAFVAQVKAIERKGEDEVLFTLSAPGAALPASRRAPRPSCASSPCSAGS